MSRDPAHEKVWESNRKLVVELGPIQPRDIAFPKTGLRKLKFQKGWYDRDREDCAKFLEYSVSQDAAFCFFCRRFGSLGKFISMILYA